MDMMEQIQMWRENGENQKIIDTLEAIPAKERTPEMDLALAREYIIAVDLYKQKYSEPLKKAVRLLKPHEEYFEDDYEWNFWTGFACYFLDQSGRALRFFQKALEIEPDDENIPQFISACEMGISQPQFLMSFKERTQLAWERFAEKEASFRQMMDDDTDNTKGDEYVRQIEEILSLAFENIQFALFIYNGKYELVLIPNANKVRLFELVYFQKHAPQNVLTHWNILVGFQPGYITSHIASDGIEINWDDVAIWLEEKSEERFALYAYCEKLRPMFAEDKSRVRSLLIYFTLNALGEISYMRHVESVDVVEKPKTDPSILLSKLHAHLKKRGLQLSTDPQAFLDTVTDYENEPDEDPNATWRLDVITASTNCMPLIDSYMCVDNTQMDKLHADGVTAGFFCYPLDTLREGERQEKNPDTAAQALNAKDIFIKQLNKCQKIVDFRRQLEDAFRTDQGSEILTFTGSAMGLYYGYVDFIAWDIKAVFEKAQAFFEKIGIPGVYFHTFYAQAYPVPQDKLSEKASEDEKHDARDEMQRGMDDIPYTPDNADAFFAQLKRWDKANEYTRCIKAIEAIPKEEWDYRLALLLARALQNYAIIGEHRQQTPTLEKELAIMHAIMVLESVQEEGHNEAEWNMRMAFSYQCLQRQEEKAIPYALRWAELDPDGEIAPPEIFLKWMRSQSAFNDIRMKRRPPQDLNRRKRSGK